MGRGYCKLRPDRATGPGYYVVTGFSEVRWATESLWPLTTGFPYICPSLLGARDGGTRRRSAAPIERDVYGRKRGRAKTGVGMGIKQPRHEVDRVIARRDRDHRVSRAILVLVDVLGSVELNVPCRTRSSQACVVYLYLAAKRLIPEEIMDVRAALDHEEARGRSVDRRRGHRSASSIRQVAEGQSTRREAADRRSCHQAGRS